MSASGSDTESLDFDPGSPAVLVVESSDEPDQEATGGIARRPDADAVNVDEVQGREDADASEHEPELADIGGEVSALQQGSAPLSMSLDDFATHTRKRKRQPSDSVDDKDGDDEQEVRD